MMDSNKKSGFNLIKAVKGFSLLQKVLLAFFLVILTIVSFPIVFILIFGLLPTITVMYTAPENYDKQLIIGCFNISGVFFYLFGLLAGFGEGVTNGIADNIFMIIVMLSTAAIGVIVYSELPNLYAYIYKISAQKRIEKINARLEKLREEWGEELVQRTKSQNEKGN